MKGRLIFFSFMSAILFLCSCNTPKKLSNTDTTRKDNTESKKPSKDPDKPKEDSSKIVNDPRSIPEKPIWRVICAENVTPCFLLHAAAPICAITATTFFPRNLSTTVLTMSLPRSNA